MFIYSFLSAMCAAECVTSNHKQSQNVLGALNDTNVKFLIDFQKLSSVEHLSLRAVEGPGGVILAPQMTFDYNF